MPFRSRHRKKRQRANDPRNNRKALPPKNEGTVLQHPAGKGPAQIRRECSMSFNNESWTSLYQFSCTAQRLKLTTFNINLEKRRLSTHATIQAC